MVTIIFEPHATTTDNEQRLSSGWNNVGLSELGVRQAKELGSRYDLSEIDVVFTSDLERAYHTATLAFDLEPRKLLMDWRLRECDYGDHTQHPKEEVDADKPHRVFTPFPNGESYEQTSIRMRSFLEDLYRLYDGKVVMVIGHRATQYGLEHWINDLELVDVVSAKWVWQPGWTYMLNKLAS